MSQNSDGLLMVIIGIAAVIVFGWRINRWLSSPAAGQMPGMPINEHIQDHPALDLLVREGYEVVGGKFKINLSFETDEGELQSRFFVDYVASDDSGGLYLVKLSRERMSVEWTGTGIRDRLMPLLLLYPECAGLLYIDQNQDVIRRVSMDWSDEEWIGNDI